MTGHKSARTHSHITSYGISGAPPNGEKCQKSPKNWSKVPKSPKNWSKMPKSPKNWSKMPKSPKNWSKMPKNFHFCKIPQNAVFNASITCRCLAAGRCLAAASCSAAWPGNCDVSLEPCTCKLQVGTRQLLLRALFCFHAVFSDNPFALLRYYYRYAENYKNRKSSWVMIGLEIQQC